MTLRGKLLRNVLSGEAQIPHHLEMVCIKCAYKNNFKHIVWKLGMHIFRIYHQNPLCLILYWFREGLRTTWCFRKSENMSTSNEAKTVWKWGRVIMIIPEVKSMDLQLSNGVPTITTWQIVAEIDECEVL